MFAPLSGKISNVTVWEFGISGEASARWMHQCWSHSGHGQLNHWLWLWTCGTQEQSGWALACVTEFRHVGQWEWWGGVPIIQSVSLPHPEHAWHCCCCWKCLQREDAHAAWTSAELWNCDWSRSAVLKASACLMTSSMVFNWVAFSRMSVWIVSLFRPYINWSLMLVLWFSQYLQGGGNTSMLES